MTYAPMTYNLLRMSKLQTVVELPEFINRAKALMSDDDRVALINMLAATPDSGISLGGGLRKVRFSREGRGKRGGCRTLYVFGGRHMPLFLLTVFAKNEKDNLTRSEQVALVELSKTLIAKYGEPS
ncbi:type II toxin-antitoxin system RelE/ParE family toxin [Acetobacter sp.]|uniref:type II toxin-antitoxin system RelE/ParE family toxin n=1 Tax=Acetobacter sp. TaxID=440 RepID=UPI0039E771F6